MFGFHLVHQTVLDADKRKLEATENMLRRMEEELGYWRERADDERERADRLTDTVMQQNGLPDVTATVRKEKKKHAEEVADTLDKHQEELSEMFSDSFDSENDLNWIDPDLQDAAQAWMNTAKEAREKRKANVESVE